MGPACSACRHSKQAAAQQTQNICLHSGSNTQGAVCVMPCVPAVLQLAVTTVQANCEAILQMQFGAGCLGINMSTINHQTSGVPSCLQRCEWPGRPPQESNLPDLDTAVA